MILTVELPQELLNRLRDAPLRLNAMRSALLTANLEGVWWGTRTAALVDRASFDQDGARKLGECLQAAQSDLFVVFEPTSEQTFVVNRRLLRERLSEHVAFVEVGVQQPALVSGLTFIAPALFKADNFPLPEQLHTRPERLKPLLDKISTHPANDPFCLLALESSSRTSDLIVLAGVLLDYATAYCVAGEGPNCLGGRELNLIEAFSITAKGQRNHLFSFSYPTEIISSSRDLAPSTVIAAVEGKLQKRFREAQRRYSELAGFSVEVKHSTVTLDQVAL
ncbi:hypothetical protein JCM10908_001747 [Rhodotorula pacifica]|uniref:uncharacterized protein n=1 Tax=Rhodotorula pacifica TaxID=1495444 RepID=UPI00317BB105